MSEHDSTLTPRSADHTGVCKCGCSFTRAAGSKYPRLCTSCALKKQNLGHGQVLRTSARPDTVTVDTVVKFLRRKG
jgi:hypothetical protein